MLRRWTLPPPGGADDTVLIIYTSGTTGFPKGAMHSQRNFVTAGEANVSRLWLQPDERMMVVLPMFHVNALFYSTAGTLAAGCTMVLMPRFSASEFWNAAVEHGVTAGQHHRGDRPHPRAPAALGVPSRAQDHASSTARAPTSLRPFRDEFRIPHLLGGFGMTEIPGVCCNPFEGPNKQGTMGPVGRHPDPDRKWAECRVVDDDGNEVGAGVIGEFWVKHPIVMQGYFRDPGADARRPFATAGS